MRRECPDDTVKRRDVVDLLTKYYRMRALDEVYNLPSAEEKESPHPCGEWFDIGSLSCRCDACGCKNNKPTRYCPNCGTLMKNAEIGEPIDYTAVKAMCRWYNNGTCHLRGLECDKVIRLGGCERIDKNGVDTPNAGVL